MKKLKATANFILGVGLILSNFIVLLATQYIGFPPFWLRVSIASGTLLVMIALSFSGVAFIRRGFVILDSHSI